MPSFNCKHGTCTALLPRPGYCEKHKQRGEEYDRDRVRLYDQTRRKHKPLYNSKAWQTLRREILTAEPICRICKREFASEVDHIASLVDCVQQGIDPLDPTNLQPLCKQCHAIKSAKERAGRGGTCS